MDGCMGGGWMDGCMGGGWLAGWMNRQSDGWTCRSMNGWVVYGGVDGVWVMGGGRMKAGCFTGLLLENAFSAFLIS